MVLCQLPFTIELSWELKCSTACWVNEIPLYVRGLSLWLWHESAMSLLICCEQAPQLFERLCLRPPRGLLLHGPPGTGKTALACAAAADAGASLFVLNGPDIISEYVGDSEIGLQVNFFSCFEHDFHVKLNLLCVTCNILFGIERPLRI